MRWRSEGALDATAVTEKPRGLRTGCLHESKPVADLDEQVCRWQPSSIL